MIPGEFGIDTRSLKQMSTNVSWRSDAAARRFLQFVQPLFAAVAAGR